jgi:hypothetical protein
LQTAHAFERTYQFETRNPLKGTLSNASVK